MQSTLSWIWTQIVASIFHDENCYSIYIVIHRQTCFVLSELFSVARQARFPKLGLKPGWRKHQSKILPLNHEKTSASEGNFNAYVSHLFLFTYIHLTATESSINSICEVVDLFLQKPFWFFLESLKAFGQKTFRRHYYLSTLPRPSIPYTEGRWSKSY